MSHYPSPIRLDVDAAFGKLSATIYSPSAGTDLTPVVLWPSIFSTAEVQSDLTALLSRKRKVLVIDPPGHGASQISVPTALSMVACAEATFALLDLAGLTAVAWVGTSWGGLVGIEAAILDGSRLISLTCLNTPFEWRGPGWGKARWLPLMAHLIGNTRLFSNGVAADFFLRETRADPTRSKVMTAHTTGLTSGNRRQLSAAAYLIFRTRRDMLPLLPKVSVPALVVAGTNDRLYSQAMQRKAASTIPLADFELVKSAHISAVDCPATIYELLQRWWAKLHKNSSAS